MSLSSRSDITLPMQDSPQPPLSDEGGGGIENKGYSPPREEKVAETINSELFNNMTIVNMIPTKPTPAFGPYEQMDDYFIPVNQHKKFLRRSEKLYVTKDKRKKSGGGWRRAFCWALALFFFLGLATVALLIALGILNFPLGNKESSEKWPFGSGSSSPSTPQDFVTSTTPFLPPPISPDPSSTYITNSADLEFYIDNKKFEAALSNRSSDAFKGLAHQLEHLVNDMLKDKLGVDGVVSRVSEFRPGSVYVKMRVGWVSDSPALEMGPILASVNNLDEYEIRLMKSYGVVNLCKFNKNGCSHICTFDMQVLSFVCACPEPLMLSEDAKTCLEEGSTTSPSVPEEEVSPEETTPTSTTTTTEVPPTEATTITTTIETTTSTMTPKAEEIVTTTPTPQTTPTSTTTTTQNPEEHPEGEEEVTTPTTTMSTTPSTTTTTEAPQAEEEPEVTTTAENLEENEGTKEVTTMPPAPAEDNQEEQQQEDNKEEESVTEEVAGEVETETSAPSEEGESSTEEPSPLIQQ